MGSDWSWTLALPEGTLTTAIVDRLLALGEAAGLSPHRPDGAINGFDCAPGHEGEHRVLDREQVVLGLATGSWATNLWDASGADVHLCTDPGDGRGWDRMYLSLDSVNCWSVPTPQAQPFRELHHRLTELWVAVAGETRALFGRVEDEWSIEQIWRDLDDPVSDAPQPAGAWPERLGWWTYFAAGHYRPLPAALDASVRRTSDGGAVVGLLADPAEVDPVRFARLHDVYWREVGVSRRSPGSGNADGTGILAR